MGKRFNRWLRAAANAGINVGTVHQASQTFHSAPKNKPKPQPKPKLAPKPAASNKVTLKPLVNKKGKVVGMGHFKGDDKQDTKAIPKKAPTTKAGKAALTEAISKTNNNIASSAKKKQAEVLPKPKLAVARAKSAGVTDAATLSNIAKAKNPLKAAKKGTQRKAVLEGAIASGVDPVAAKGLGLVKSIPKASTKAKAQVQIAKAGGDVQSQIDVANSKKPMQKAQASIPGVQAAKQYGDQVKAIEKYNAAAAEPPKRNFVGQGGAFRRDNDLKRKKKRKGARYSSSRGTDSLRVPLNTGSPGQGGGGINP